MNYIVTATNKEFLPLFKEFVISLFTLGEFKGKLVCFYYYKDEHESDEFFRLVRKKFDVKFIKKKITYDLNQSVYIYLYKLISSGFFKKKDKIAIYDTDIWFQDEINSLFEQKTKRLFASSERYDPKEISDHAGSNLMFYFNKPNIKLYCNEFNQDERADIKKRYEALAKEGYNFFNSGMIFGDYYDIRNYIIWINSYYDKYPLLKIKVSPDQFLFNYYVDTELDSLDDYRYNYCIFYSNGWKINEDKKFVSHDNILVKAIHLQKFKNKVNYSFLNFYPEYVELMESIGGK